MRIEDNLRVIKLIDIYGVLLTRKQYDIASSYYFDNLSLSEIGENFSISRQAVSDSLNQSVKALEGYEDKLNIIAKNDAIISSLSTLKDNTKDTYVVAVINQIIDYIRG